MRTEPDDPSGSVTSNLLPRGEVTDNGASLQPASNRPQRLREVGVFRVGRRPRPPFALWKGAICRAERDLRSLGAPDQPGVGSTPHPSSNPFLERAYLR